MTVKVSVTVRDGPRLGVSTTKGPSVSLGSGAVQVPASNYEDLTNKPTIEDVELVGNKELDDFGMGTASYYDIAMLFV